MTKKILGIILNVIVVLGTTYYANLVLLQSQFSTETELKNFYATNNFANFVSMLVCLLVIILFATIIGSPIVSSGLFLILVEVLAFVNFNKLTARQAPFYPEELTMITETKSLSNMVDRNDLFILIGKIFLIIFFVVSLLFIFRIFKLRLKSRVHWILRGIFFLLILFPISKIPTMGKTDSKLTNYLIANGTDIVHWGWNQPGNYDANGFLLCFIYNAIPQPVMEEPDGYSKETIEEIIEKYQNKSVVAQGTPLKNIVFILSESFTDPNDVLESITPSKDPIPYIHSIMESNTSGRILVSEYGGGTANMEFDLLTGFSTSMFTGIPFQDVVPKNQDFPSFIKVLEKFGYEATAIHPYDGNMYKRSSVYPNLGIDNFIDIRSITHDSKIDNSTFVSDESAYDEVLDVLKENDNNQVVQLVTMQNHQPYSTTVYDDNITVTSDKVSQAAKDKISAYWTGLSYTDKATEQFLNELNNLSEDTIVVFYGDHYPGQNVFGDLFTGGINDYLTPFFIYDTATINNISADDDSITSLNFIQLKVMEMLGLEYTPFMNLLSSVNNDWTAMSRTYGVDQDDNTYSPAQLSGLTFSEYQLINYDIIEGEKYSLNSNFYLGD